MALEINNERNMDASFFIKKRKSFSLIFVPDTYLRKTFL